MTRDECCDRAIQMLNSSSERLEVEPGAWLAWLVLAAILLALMEMPQ